VRVFRACAALGQSRSWSFSVLERFWSGFGRCGVVWGFRAIQHRPDVVSKRRMHVVCLFCRMIVRRMIQVLRVRRPIRSRRVNKVSSSSIARNVQPEKSAKVVIKTSIETCAGHERWAGSLLNREDRHRGWPRCWSFLSRR
jgi:hypothetical protein